MQDSSLGFGRGIAATLAAVFLCASPRFAQTKEIELVSPDKGTTIQANGSGRVRRTPDDVDVTVGINTTASTATEAQAVADVRQAYITDDQHWHPEGHAVVAETIRSAVQGPPHP